MEWVRWMSQNPHSPTTFCVSVLFECKPGTGRNHYLLFTWAQLSCYQCCQQWTAEICYAKSYITTAVLMYISCMFSICFQYAQKKSIDCTMLLAAKKIFRLLFIQIRPKKPNQQQIDFPLTTCSGKSSKKTRMIWFSQFISEVILHSKTGKL